MSTLNLSQSAITAYDGTPVRLVYAHEADMLEIFFGVNEPAASIDRDTSVVCRSWHVRSHWANLQGNH